MNSAGEISLSIATTAYLAIGNGGGLYPEYKEKNNQIISFMKEGHIDWEAVVAYNKKSSAAKNIITDYIAGHTQFGIKSSVSVDFYQKVRGKGGVHWQRYNKWEKERIKELLGAEYWYEDYAKNSIAGLAGRNPYKKRGDYIRIDNGQNIDYITLYLSANMTLDGRGKFLLTTGASISSSYIERWDKYNYVDDIYCDMAHGLGGSFKAGLLYKAGKADSFYLNGGLYSRAPYPNIFFASGNNNISRGTKNENNYVA